MPRLLHRPVLVVPLAVLACMIGVESSAAEASRQCIKAQRKVTKEQNWAVRAEATSERDRRARASCATAEVCARYDARLREMDKRKLRHEARLERFRADAARACTSG